MLLIVSIDFSLVPFLELLDVILIVIFFILHQLFVIIKLFSDFLDFICGLFLHFLIVEVILLNQYFNFFCTFLFFLSMMPLNLIDIFKILDFSICIPLFQCLHLLSEFMYFIKKFILLFLVSS